MTAGNGKLSGRDLEAARCLSCSVVVQGQVAVLDFRVAEPSDVVPGGQVAIAMPVSGLPGLRAAVHRAMDIANRADGWYPRAFSIGHPTQQRGTVAITFDEAPHEMTYLFRDDAAKKLAEAVMSDIIGRMDAAERAKLQTGLMTPARRIILPGR